MSRLPVSACLIVKDEPLLERAIASIRDHVTEICILDSSTDPKLAAIAKSLADVYAREDDGCQDFARLRDRSFALATKPFVLWLDADDEVDGLEHLTEALETMAIAAPDRGALLVCPYEYSFDEEGRCTRRQRRERVVYRRDLFHWEHPAHETLVSTGGRSYNHILEDRIVWKHRRDTASNAGRALRILGDFAADHPDKLSGPDADPWLLANLGHELFAAGRFDESRLLFEAYVATPGDREPRALAHVKLCDLAIGRADWLEALRQASEAHKLAEWLLQTGYALGRAHFLVGMMHPTADREMELRLSLKALCLALWQTRTTSQGVNPRDRYDARTLAATIYEMLGHPVGALGQVEAQLAEEPEDPPALLRRRDLVRAVSEAADPTLGALDIVIACGDSPTPWNPRLVARGADVYGSELAVVEMAKRLAAEGHRVRVYNRPGTPGLYDGVEYRDWPTAPGLAGDDSCDVLVAWRDARGLEAIRAKTRLLWVHDVTAFALTPERALLCDRFLALSEWHKAALVKAHGLDPKHVHVTRNGVDGYRFRQACVHRNKTTHGRSPHRAIYSSSPDRGLLLLLDLWPRILAQVPDAELRVFYGHESWKASAAKLGGQTPAYVVATLERRLAETPGVTYCGRVPPDELAREMVQAGVWAYPTWFDETSCMGAMEAQAARLRIVTTRRAALGETVIAGTLLDGDPLTADYQDAFVAAVVDEMRHGDARRDWDRENHCPNPFEVFSWDAVAAAWLTLFASLLEDAKHGFVPPYEPFQAVAA